MFGPNLWEKEPDFVNEKGIKWWHEKDLTSYAKLKGLSNVTCWIVRRVDGSMTRLIIKDEEVIYEDTTFEGIACYIDILWMSKL